MKLWSHGVKKTQRLEKNGKSEVHKGKKFRHKILDDKEINDIGVNLMSSFFKRIMSWALTVFKDWLTENQMSADFEAENHNQVL